jgi:hypothetical protein
VLVIAPLSANTLGKIANGLCDNLLVGVGLLIPRSSSWLALTDPDRVCDADLPGTGLGREETDHRGAGDEHTYVGSSFHGETPPDPAGRLLVPISRAGLQAPGLRGQG